MRLFILTTSLEFKQKLEPILQKYFELEFFETASNTMERMRKLIPDGIVMDHTLSDLPTYTFIDRIRNKAATRHLPFVIVSRESSAASLEKAVRSGVSHYIGIPFEPQMLVERVLFALNPSQASGASERRVSHRVEYPVHATLFGRISFITKELVHLEAHVNPQIGSTLIIRSPLSEDFGMDHLEVVVKSVGRDTFYNYPFAIDAEWKNDETKAKVKSFVIGNRHLNSPKKIKILFVEPNLKRQELFATKIRANSYSVRFANDLKTAILDIPFMKPTGLVVPYHLWSEATEREQNDFLKVLNENVKHWILYGDEAQDPIHSPLKPFEAPGDGISILFAVEELMPPLKPDPEVLYFSKLLEDSRVKIFLDAKVVGLQEMGLDLEFSKEVIPPFNLQLDLKALSNANLRNPYLRAWPPSSKIKFNGEDGVAVRSHFLGINDSHGQAVRQWLIDEEMKKERKKIEAVAPKPTSAEEIAEMKKKEKEREDEARKNKPKPKT